MATSTECSVVDQCRFQSALIERLNSLPLLNAAARQAAFVYSRSKDLPLLGTTLDTTEGAIKSVADRAQPLVQYITPPISAMDKFACEQFCKIESKYPVIKSSPEEVIDFGKRRFNESYLKKSIDIIASAKDFGLQKVNDAINLCTEMIPTLTLKNGQKADLEKVIHLSQQILSASLDYADALVDRYVAVDQVDKDHLADDIGYVSRVQSLSTKLLHGINTRAAKSYSSAKEMTHAAFQQALDSIQLMEALKKLQAYVDQRSPVAFAQMETQKAVDYLRKSCGNLASTVDSTTIRLVHLLAMNACLVSNQLSKYSQKYLPENANVATSTAVGYMNDLSDTVMKAKSTVELKDELITEAGCKIEQCRKRFIDAVANTSAANWLTFNIVLDDEDTTEDDDDEYDWLIQSLPYDVVRRPRCVRMG